MEICDAHMCGSMCAFADHFIFSDLFVEDAGMFVSYSLQVLSSNISICHLFSPHTPPSSL